MGEGPGGTVPVSRRGARCIDGANDQPTARSESAGRKDDREEKSDVFDFLHSREERTSPWRTLQASERGRNRRLAEWEHARRPLTTPNERIPTRSNHSNAKILSWTGYWKNSGNSKWMRTRTVASAPPRLLRLLQRRP